MHLYKTKKGNFIVFENKGYFVDQDWDSLVNQDNLHTYLSVIVSKGSPVESEKLKDAIVLNLLAPIGSQELWASGVTYLRSRDARMEESKKSGAADCYQMVYEAERPELFFKSLPHRVAAHQEAVFIRRDSSWNVPEPELTLLINSKGTIIAYTVGNDMSSRSIEGENPLYLPQAKMYERAAALGPCLFVPEQPIPLTSTISVEISRNSQVVFEGSVTLERMKRTLTELAGYLFREFAFKYGAMLMTGTGVVPPDDFTLEVNDVVSITIEGIGTLTNTVKTADSK